MTAIENLLYNLEGARCAAESLQRDYPALSRMSIGNIDAVLGSISQAIDEAEHIEGNLKQLE